MAVEELGPDSIEVSLERIADSLALLSTIAGHFHDALLMQGHKGRWNFVPDTGKITSGRYDGAGNRKDEKTP